MIMQSNTTKKAIAADPEYAEAYSNVGLVYLMKAQDYADKSNNRYQ